MVCLLDQLLIEFVSSAFEEEEEEAYILEMGIRHKLHDRVSVNIESKINS